MICGIAWHFLICFEVLMDLNLAKVKIDLNAYVMYSNLTLFKSIMYQLYLYDTIVSSKII